MNIYEKLKKKGYLYVTYDAMSHECAHKDKPKFYSDEKMARGWVSKDWILIENGYVMGRRSDIVLHINQAIIRSKLVAKTLRIKKEKVKGQEKIKHILEKLKDNKKCIRLSGLKECRKAAKDVNRGMAESLVNILIKKQ